MQKKESSEIRDLRDRIIRLETLVEAEFKNMRDLVTETCKHIDKLNEEYGVLIQKHNELELKQQKEEDAFKRTIFYWKVMSPIVMATVTSLIILIIHAVIGF